MGRSRHLALAKRPGGGSRRLARDGWRGAVADGGQGHDGAGEREQCGDVERVVEAVQVGGLGWVAAAERLAMPEATIVPMTAMPREPPTCRIELSTADPTPALATGTERITAAVAGVIDIPMPIPPAHRPGSRAQKGAWAPSREK